MTNIGYATLSVIPTLTGVSGAIEKQLDGLTGIGKTAGRKLGDGIASGVDAAAQQVEQASAKVVAARDKEADAAGKVRVAEEQLKALRDKGVTDAGRLAAAEERTLKAKRDLQSVTTTLSREVANEAAAQDRLADAKDRADKAGSGFGRFRTALAGIHEDAGRATTAIGGIATKLTSLVGMGGVLSLPGLALAKGFQRLQNIDEAKAKLVALGQDTASVDMIMKNALASVDKTSFGLGDAAGVAGMIVGAGIKPGQELERTLKLVADTAAITGGGLGEIGGIFGKVAAKGKLDGEVMAQLLERQVGILPKLAEHYGVTSEEAQKMVSDGKVSFADFQTVMDGLVGGGAQKMGKTFGATLANMNAALGRLGAAVLGPVFDKLPGLFDGMTKAVDAVTPKLKGIGEILSKYSGWVTPVAAGIGAVVAGMVAWKTATVVMTAVQTAFNVVLAANPIGLIVLAIVGLGTALVVAYKKSETFRNVVNGVWNAVKGVIGGVVSWFTDTAWPAIQSAWTWITEAFGKGRELIGTAIDGVKDIWQGLMDKAAAVKDWVVGRWDAMVGFFKELPGKITAAAVGMWDGIGNAFKAMIDRLKGWWNDFASGLSFTTPEWLPGDPMTFSLPKFGYWGGGHTGNGPADQVAGVVHGGEFVVRKDSTDKIQNAYPGLLDYLNNKGALPGYQGGGQVALGNISGPGITTAEQQSMWDAVRSAFPGAILTSATRTVMTEGHRDFHNEGRAIDISGPSMGPIAAWIASNYPDSLELIHSPFGHNIKRGKNVGDGMAFYGQGLMAAHQDHVHWALGKTAKSPQPKKTAEADSSGAVSAPRTPTPSADMAGALGLNGTGSTGISAAESSPAAATPADAGGRDVSPFSLSGMSGSLSGFGSWGGQFAGDQASKSIGDSLTGGGKELDPRLKTAVGGLGDLGSAAGQLIDGQISSALGVLGVGDSPGWLKGLSTFASGLSFGGGGGASMPTPATVAGSAATSAVGAASSALGSVHAGTGAQPGAGVTYNIRTATVEDAFLQTTRLEKERAAAKLSRY